MSNLEKLRKAMTTSGVALLAAAFSYSLSGVLVGSRPAFALSADKSFSITSKVYASTCTKTPTAKLSPGVGRCLAVTVHDPLSVAIHVTSLSARVRATTAPCTPAWLTLPSTLPHTFTVPARGTHAVTGPIELETSGTNQDSCENGTFILAYSASGTYTDTTTVALATSGSGHQRTLHATVTPADPSSDPYGPGSTTAPVHHVVFYACTTSACTSKTSIVTKTLTTSTSTTLAATATAKVAGLSEGTHTFEAVYPATETHAGTFAGSSAVASTSVAAAPTSVPPPAAPPGARFIVTSTDVPGVGKPVVPGEAIDYSIDVTNAGTATGTAVVTDLLPANATLTGTPACAAVAGDGTCALTLRATTLTAKVHLAKGDTAKVAFDAVVSSTDTSSVLDTATITTGPCTGSECSSSVTNPVVVLDVTSSSTPPPRSVVPLATRITYTLTATDSGTAPTTPLTLTDTVPRGTIYVIGSATCGGAPGCSVTEATGTIAWSGLFVQPGAAHALSVSFAAVVDKADTNGEKITNVASFTNEGTPACTTATCSTNTITLVVSAKSSTPSHSTPPTVSPIPASTTPHTGEPFAGSWPFELMALLAGLGLLGAGERLRHRQRRLAREGPGNGRPCHP